MWGEVELGATLRHFRISKLGKLQALRRFIETIFEKICRHFHHFLYILRIFECIFCSIIEICHINTSIILKISKKRRHFLIDNKMFYLSYYWICQHPNRLYFEKFQCKEFSHKPCLRPTLNHINFPLSRWASRASQSFQIDL